jgi:[CysO sulfur-carrier protein]-S-L-cysteine hydrolase
MDKRGQAPVRIVLDAAARAEMLQHAREEAPNECCGLLIGRRGSVESTVRARNLQPGPTRYLIDPADHFGAIRTARSKGQRVVGAYHSHPSSPPAPSESDIAEATGGRDFLYVIVSPADGGLRGYYLTGNDVIFVDLLAT